jgi:hypothetical protein
VNSSFKILRGRNNIINYMKSLNLNGVREKQLHERIEYYIDSQVITDECVAYPEESVESTLKKSYIISTE